MHSTWLRCGTCPNRACRMPCPRLPLRYTVTTLPADDRFAIWMDLDGWLTLQTSCRHLCQLIGSCPAANEQHQNCLLACLCLATLTQDPLVDLSYVTTTPRTPC